MPNLILRASGLDDPQNEFALQLRYHDSVGETDYLTLKHVSREIADDIVAAGACTWLFGRPSVLQKS
jgi:hypothetical protein